MAIFKGIQVFEIGIEDKSSIPFFYGLMWEWTRAKTSLSDTIPISKKLNLLYYKVNPGTTETPLFSGIINNQELKNLISIIQTFISKSGCLRSSLYL